jgi:hypothetical protein
MIFQNLSVCLCKREGGRERGSVFMCTGDSSLYHHQYDHFITGFQQQINHNNTQHTNQKASVMFFLSCSVSLPNGIMSVSGPTIDFGEPKKKFPEKQKKTTTRSRDPRSAFFRGTSVGVGREDDRRARRVQSDGGFHNPSSRFRLLECTSYIPTYLPTYIQMFGICPFWYILGSG